VFYRKEIKKNHGLLFEPLAPALFTEFNLKKKFQSTKGRFWSNSLNFYNFLMHKKASGAAGPVDFDGADGFCLVRTTNLKFSS